LATISARIAPALPVPSPRRPGRTAGQGGSRGPHSIQRIGLARAPPVLAVGPVHLDDPDPGGADVPGQPGAVAAGALDADQADRAEALQPAQ
jgi:hypothetical protein